MSSGCGDRICTYDLWLMGPANYQLLYPAVKWWPMQTKGVQAERPQGHKKKPTFYSGSRLLSTSNRSRLADWTPSARCVDPYAIYLQFVSLTSAPKSFTPSYKFMEKSSKKIMGKNYAKICWKILQKMPHKFWTTLPHPPTHPTFLRHPLANPQHCPKNLTSSLTPYTLPRNSVISTHRAWMSYNSNSVLASILQSIASSAWHAACILHHATTNKRIDNGLFNICRSF